MTIQLRDGTCRIRSFLCALIGCFLHTATSHRLEIHSGCERDQSFIRADVRRGFLTTNVLFARGEREHKSAPAFLVVSFTDESPGNLACVFFTRREQADVRTTERERHAKRLPLCDDDVCATRAG